MKKARVSPATILHSTTWDGRRRRELLHFLSPLAVPRLWNVVWSLAIPCFLHTGILYCSCRVRTVQWGGKSHQWCGRQMCGCSQTGCPTSQPTRVVLANRSEVCLVLLAVSYKPTSFFSFDLLHRRCPGACESGWREGGCKLQIPMMLARRVKS